MSAGTEHEVIAATPPLAAAEPSLLAIALAELPRPWLVGVDVDGTLAPIVARPEMSALEPGAIDALEALIACVGVSVAVVSGRPLTHLRHRFEIPSGAMLLGSHGAEVGTEVDHRSDAEQARIDAAVTVLESSVADLPGAWIERKPLAVALHVRQVDDERGEDALAELRRTFAGVDGITMHRGHKVLELAVRPTTKATAFAQLRTRLEPATTFFLGDDSSDELVFASLGANDVTIKVGAGATVARQRLASPTDVVAVLRDLSGALSTAVR
ncbi:MAG: otsB [Ilumatobacteraceae bacterium]|nr:otsB [Ilumatobacteraceae bacterium]